MKILVTGGTGGVGSVLSQRLIEKNYDVVMLTQDNLKNRIFADKNKDIKFVWGDIRNFNDTEAAVKNVDVVIHLAFVLQPKSEEETDYSRDVNVNGTKNLINAINNENRKIKLIFSSSTTVYGITRNEKPPITLDHGINPVVEYSKHKVECEKLIKDSIENYVILRFSEIGHFQFSATDFEYIYRLPVCQRTEFLHVEDAATALINSIDCDEIIGKTLIISGGKKNQLIHYERVKYVNKKAYGLGPPPKKRFTKKPYPLDWYDTSESQKILKYQKRTIDDYVEDIKNNLAFNPFIIRFFAPIINLVIYSKILSPIYKLVLNYYYEYS